MATRERGGPSDRRPTGVSERYEVSRYDLLLGVIPAAFVVSVLVGHFMSVPIQVSVAVGSLVGAGVVVDGLFLNPPVSSGQ